MIILTTDKQTDQYILHYKVLPGTLEAATCFWAIAIALPAHENICYVTQIADRMDCYSSAAPAQQIFASRFFQL